MASRWSCSTNVSATLRLEVRCGLEQKVPHGRDHEPTATRSSRCRRNKELLTVVLVLAVEAGDVGGRLGAPCHAELSIACHQPSRVGLEAPWSAGGQLFAGPAAGPRLAELAARAANDWPPVTLGSLSQGTCLACGQVGSASARRVATRIAGAGDTPASKIRSQIGHQIRQKPRRSPIAGASSWDYIWGGRRDLNP